MFGQKAFIKLRAHLHHPILNQQALVRFHKGIYLFSLKNVFVSLKALLPQTTLSGKRIVNRNIIGESNQIHKISGDVSVISDE